MTPNLTGQSQGNPSPVYAMLKCGHEGVDSAQPGGQPCLSMCQRAGVAVMAGTPSHPCS